MPGHENRPAVLPRLWETLTLAVLPALMASLDADPAWAADADADGIDDEFELFFGLNTAADDSALDPDGDGLNNLAESQRGTDPFAADTDRDGFWDGWDSNALSRAWVGWGAPGFTRSNAMVYAWPAEVSAGRPLHAHVEPGIEVDEQ